MSGWFDGAEDGEHSGSNCVEISKYVPCRSGFLTKQSHLTRYTVNFISLLIACVGLREEEPQTVPSMSITWVSHIAASVLTGR